MDYFLIKRKARIWTDRRFMVVGADYRVVYLPEWSWMWTDGTHFVEARTFANLLRGVRNRGYA